jgi:hypothetical protein
LISVLSTRARCGAHAEEPPGATTSFRLPRRRIVLGTRKVMLVAQLLRGDPAV